MEHKLIIQSNNLVTTSHANGAIRQIYHYWFAKFTSSSELLLSIHQETRNINDRVIQKSCNETHS